MQLLLIVQLLPIIRFLTSSSVLLVWPECLERYGLIICAMVFGGAMDGIGALETISEHLLKMATSVFGLFASTVVSCLTLNATASDQYLALVIPGKMFFQCL